MHFIGIEIKNAHIGQLWSNGNNGNPAHKCFDEIERVAGCVRTSIEIYPVIAVGLFQFLIRKHPTTHGCRFISWAKEDSRETFRYPVKDMIATQFASLMHRPANREHYFFGSVPVPQLLLVFVKANHGISAKVAGESFFQR